MSFGAAFEPRQEALPAEAFQRRDDGGVVIAQRWHTCRDLQRMMADRPVQTHGQQDGGDRRIARSELQRPTGGGMAQ